MVYVFYTKADKNEIPSGISKYREKKITDAKHPDERRLMIAASAVLKAGTAFFGIDESAQNYTVGDFGKPSFELHPEIHFSLSHAGNIAIAAFSHSNVGIDCEPCQRKVSIDVLHRFFNQNESDEFVNDPLLLWVSKESIAKLTGKGLINAGKKYTVPYFENKTVTKDGVFLKKTEILGHIAVISTEKEEEIIIKEV